MTDRKRWKEPDILRGMAILMVLLYHSIIVFPLNLHEIRWCEILHTFLWTVQMPLFFLVSGFCYSFQGSYRTYALKKCRRILVPHIVFSALDILPRLIPNPLVHEQMDAGEALTDFLLYGGSDWFLWTLFVIVMAFPALEVLLTGRENGRMDRPVMKKAAISAVVLLFLLKPVMPDLFLLNMVSQYLLYYFLGYGLSRKADLLFLSEGEHRMQETGGQARSPLLSGKRGTCTLILAAAGMLFFFGICLLLRGSGSVGLLAEAVCVLCSFLFFAALSVRCRGRIADFLVCCGKWSLQMYLLDAYALVLTRTVLVSVLGIRSPWVIIAGNFAADTLIVLLLSRFILTKAKVFRFACGIPEKG